jgi:hypothetical protein
MHTETTLTLHPAIHVVVILGMAAGLLLLTLYSYSRTHREITRQNRLFFVLFRCLALGIVLLCLLRPSLTHVDVTREAGWVLLLLDNSRSMLIKDMPGEVTRADALLAGLQDGSIALKRLEELYPKHVMRMLVGREARVWDTEKPDWTEKATALGSALEKAAKIARGKKMAGIVLFTDGSNNFGPEPVQTALALRDLAAPLYCFGIGKEDGIAMRDAKVVDVVAPKKVFSGNQFPVDAELHFLGMEGETVPVAIKFDGQEIETQQVVIRSSQEVSRVRFVHRAVLPGSHTIAVSVPAVQGELSESNNSETTCIDVLQGGLNVLYLDGKLRPEFGFLRRSLEAAQNLVLTVPLPFHISGPDRMARFLKDTDLNMFHVFLIGDLPAKAFPAGTLEMMKKMVGERGAGLAMLGGYDSFGPGGYGESELATVLPVDMAADNAQDEEPTPVVPTDEGMSHFLLALETDADENKKAWASLPRLKGLNHAGKPKPGASVLAVSGAGHPLIAVQEYGKGRSAAILGDTTYRWVLGQETKVAVRHRKFWRQVILWLASRDKLDQKTLLLNVEKFSYRLGEETKVFAEVTDEKGNAVSDARIDLTVQLEGAPDKPQALAVSFTEDHYEAVYSAREEGTYLVKASATHKDVEIGQKETRFRLTVPDREFDAPFANLKLVRKIAEASGGSYHSLDALETVLQEILDKKLATEIRRERHEEIWNNFWVFGVFVFLLVVEWVVRRRRGLV